MKKKNYRTKKNTFNAKVDIVTRPDIIKYYPSDRNDYTELAFDAIKNKPSTIKYISPNYKDYAILCEEAINQDISVFPLIDNKVSNYKTLATKAITINPALVSYVRKDAKDYMFLWNLAISLCYKTLGLIDSKKSELFPLIEDSINKEPYAIYYVDKDIPIYSNLCKKAYSKNNDTVNYMDINKLDYNTMLDSIKKYPNNIRYLDSKNEHYLEAWEIALKIDGTLIKYIYSYNFINNKEEFLHLLNIGMENNPEIVDYPSIINMFLIYNRKQKEKLENTNNYLGDNLSKLINDLDIEYKKLKKSFIEAEKKEINERKNKSKEIDFSNFKFNECPIVKRKRKLLNR